MTKKSRMNIKITLIFLSLFLFVSCEDPVKCNGFFEVMTLKNLYIENLEEVKPLLEATTGMGNADEYIERFFNDVVDVEYARKTDINKELKLCECSANLIFKLSPQQEEALESLPKQRPELAYFKSKLFSDLDLNITYSIQELEEGLFVETDPLQSVLSERIMLFYYLEKALDERIKESESYKDYKKELPEVRGIINASNVIIREDRTTSSEAVGLFKSKDESVRILQIFDGRDGSQALIKKKVAVKIDGNIYELDKNKAVNILMREDGLVNLSFRSENGNSITAWIEEEYVEELERHKWFEERRNSGEQGWVYGKFVDYTPTNETAKKFIQESSQYCYQILDDFSSEGESIILLQFSIDTDNNVTGNYRYYPSVEMDSWGGDFTGTLGSNNIIEGTLSYSAEGRDIVKPFNIRFDHEVAEYSASEEYYYVDGKKYESSREVTVLDRINCE